MALITNLNHAGFVTITKTKAINDVIEIFEYENTDGSYIPSITKARFVSQICLKFL